VHSWLQMHVNTINELLSTNKMEKASCHQPNRNPEVGHTGMAFIHIAENQQCGCFALRC